MSLILGPIDPNREGLQRNLADYKQLSEKRLLRKGERPRDYQSRGNSILVLNKTYLEGMAHNNDISDGRAVLMAMENPYPPSVAPMGGLKKLMIKDLQLETHHRGFYLLLRFTYTASRLNDVSNVAEDEAGSSMLFHLLMQQVEAIRRADTILKQKGVIILKEPFFTDLTSGDLKGGDCYIRVDHPTDIVWLAEDDARIPEKWRVEAAQIPNAAEHWKKKGNEMVKEANYYEAIDM
jgi:hypothetical protein